MICPTCGHDTLDPGLCVVSATRTISYMGETRRLTNQQTIIAKTLLDRFAHPVKADVLYRAMYGDRIDGGPDGPKTVLKTQLFHLRQKLIGWPFEIIAPRGCEPLGWSLCRSSIPVAGSTKLGAKRA